MRIETRAESLSQLNVDMARLKAAKLTDHQNLISSRPNSGALTSDSISISRTAGVHLRSGLSHTHAQLNMLTAAQIQVDELSKLDRAVADLSMTRTKASMDNIAGVLAAAVQNRAFETRHNEALKIGHDIAKLQPDDIANTYRLARDAQIDNSSLNRLRDDARHDLVAAANIVSQRNAVDQVTKGDLDNVGVNSVIQTLVASINDDRFDALSAHQINQSRARALLA